MRRLNILMLSSALAVLGTEALAGELVINPFPTAPQSQSQEPAEPVVSSPEPALPSPPQEEPLSVSASEFMELDPDLVQTPLGRLEPVPAPEPEMVIDVVEPDEQVLEPPPLPPLETLDVAPAVAQTPGGQAAQPVMVEQPVIEASPAAHSAPHVVLQRRPGLVYIRDGQILDTVSAPSPAETVMHTAPAQEEEILWSEAPAAQWSAFGGDDMRQTLERWSGQAGVRLIWEATVSFVLKTPVAVSGNYESAVEAVLDQYQGAQNRPVAQLYNDPQAQGRVLVVRAQG